MRLEASGLLPVLALVALALVANALQRSSGTEQSDHVESSNETSLKIVVVDADEEVTDVALGDSRTGINGVWMKHEAKLPEHMSVLWCPKITNQQDGHLCGWMMWLTDQHFLAGNDAVSLMRSQLNKKEWAPPAGFRRHPPNPMNISETLSMSKDEDDWKYRFGLSKSIRHGMGLFRVETYSSLGPEKLEAKKDFTHEYNVYPNDQRPETDCYVMIYGVGRRDIRTKTRELWRIKLKNTENLDNGRSTFKLDGDNNPELCGEHSDVGAPISCRDKQTTHVVTKIVKDKNQACGTLILAMNLIKFSNQLTKFTETPPEHMSVLWCPKTIVREDGHLCGWMMWLTDHHFLASNDAVYLVRSQLNKDWSPPAGWRRHPPNQIDVNEALSMSRDEEDWKYRFKFSRTIQHGIGLYRLETDLSLFGETKAYPAPLETKKDFIHEYYVNRDEKRRELGCHLMIYGSDKKDSQTSARIFKRVQVKYVDNLKEGKFSFELDDELTPELCGEYSNVGAPISCREGQITHLVTELIKQPDQACTKLIHTIKLSYFGSLTKMDDTVAERPPEPKKKFPSITTKAPDRNAPLDSLAGGAVLG